MLISESVVEEFMKQRDLNPDYVLDIKKIIELLNEKYKKSTYKKIIQTLENFPVS